MAVIVGVADVAEADISAVAPARDRVAEKDWGDGSDGTGCV